MENVEFDKMRDGDVVQMVTVDGRRNAQINVSTTLPFQQRNERKNVAFVVPPGYVRYRFSTSNHHNGGGDNANVNWLNGDPHDGTVHMEVNCSGVNGRAHAEVSAAYAIKADALLRMHQESVAYRDANPE